MTYYILASIGFTFIIKYGSILDWIRKPLLKFDLFKELFSCSLCIGFWTGLCVGTMAYFIENNSAYFLMPLVSAGMSWFADGLIGVLQSLEIYLDDKNK